MALVDSTVSIYYLLAAVFVFLLLQWTQQRRGRKKINESTKEDEIVIELLPVEKVCARSGRIGHSATSTVTWFKGDHTHITERLRERAKTILEFNPWLGGQLVKRDGEWTLVYCTRPDVERHFRIGASAKHLSRDVPLSKLGSLLTSETVKYGFSEPQWKISVIPCSQQPNKFFAVVCSLSHSFADGHTFYRIQNMLLNNQEDIEALNCKRIMSTEEQQIDALGGESAYKLTRSPGFILNFLFGKVCSTFSKSKTTSHMYLINENEMKAAKKEAALNNNKVSFVSTNDVITSWFFQKSRCNHGIMAVDFRGKLEGHTENHAGKYANVIFYGTKDSSTPDLIRKSIGTTDLSEGEARFQRRISGTDPLPSFWTLVGGSIAVITNWASFAKPSLLEGCTEDIHIPLFDMASMVPATMASLIIFRAGPRGNAILFAGPPDKIEELKKGAPFLSSKPIVN